MLSGNFYTETNTTADWVIIPFIGLYDGKQFLSTGVLIIDDSANDISIAFPPADDTPTVEIVLEGTLKGGDVLSFDRRQVKRIAVKSVAGGDAFRLWAW